MAAIQARLSRMASVLQQSFSARSLRAQLTLWSFLLTTTALALCGSLLYVYLAYALSSSRSDSMLKRDGRLVRFLSSDEAGTSAYDLRGAMQHFLQATPETDLVVIADAHTGELLYASSATLQWLHGSPDACLQPCLTTLQWKGRRFRVLTHTVDLHGRVVRSVLAGSIDEHYDILRAVSGGFISLIPLVLLGAAIGGYYLSRRALIPVGRLTAQARVLGLEDLRLRIDVPRTKDELQELALAWNEMLARLETSTARISQFSADASHDLRTAITIMLANAELTLRQEREPKRYQDALRTITQEAARMREMIDGLLLTANPGWSPEELKLERVDLGQLLADVFEAHKAAVTIKCQAIQLVACPASTVVILADRALIARLLNILVDNAVKYTPAGGKILLAVRVGQDYTRIEVNDNGVGIPAEMQQQIFERLVRISPERTHSKEWGYGLGLSIARWIAERHGFTLEVISELNQGSSFRVVVPLQVTSIDNDRLCASGLTFKGPKYCGEAPPE